ncbi:MAG: phosphate signaling complex protein PhoU [Dehalococcoidia bacterium]
MTASRVHFVEQLESLQRDIRTLAEDVDERLGEAFGVLESRDASLANDIVEGDHAINMRRHELEQECVRLLAEQAPVAGDLRLTVAALFAATELERVGDYAVAIARIASDIPGDASLPFLGDIQSMGEQARAMLRSAVSALLERDAAVARDLARQDEAVDAAQQEIFARIVDRERVADAFEACAETLWIVHNIERVADRATNIAERALYVTTGEVAELN